MGAILGVVSCLGMVDDPLRVVGSMVEHNVHNTQHSLVSETLHSRLQLSESLRRRDARGGVKVVIVDRGLPCDRVVAKGLSVLLDWGEMDGVVAQLSHVPEDLWPSRHLSQASRHQCHQRQLLASNLLACSRHHRLHIDVLSRGIVSNFGIDLIFVSDLHKETSTVLKKHSILELVLTGSGMRLNHFQILSI